MPHPTANICTARRATAMMQDLFAMRLSDSGPVIDVGCNAAEKTFSWTAMKFSHVVKFILWVIASAICVVATPSPFVRSVL